MSDALGDALQKLSAADTAVALPAAGGPCQVGTGTGEAATGESCPSACPSSSVCSAAPTDSDSRNATADASETPHPESAVTVFNTTTQATPASLDAGSTTVSEESSTKHGPVATAAPETPSPAATRFQLLRAGLQEHRHIVAAVVIVVCAAAFWKDTQAPPVTVAGTEDDGINIESLIDDFETADQRSLPEPAEPVDFDSDRPPLIIPSQVADNSAPEFSPNASEPVTAAYPDAESTGNAPTAAAPQGRAKPLRFTGRIQPAR